MMENDRRSVLSEEQIEKFIEEKLQNYSRDVFEFTKTEIYNLAEYDVLQIISFLYNQVDFVHKKQICRDVENQFSISNISEVFEIELKNNETFYVPWICKLFDRIPDRTASVMAYIVLFEATQKLAIRKWDKNDSFSTYLVLLHAAYFKTLAIATQQRTTCRRLFKNYYQIYTYSELVNKLFEENAKVEDWNKDIDFDVLDKIRAQANKVSIPSVTMESCDAIIKCRQKIHHVYSLSQDIDESGIYYIQKKTGITYHKQIDLDGFECYFCMATNKLDEYIIVYQSETRLNEIIEDENRWLKFQRDLYYADIRDGKSNNLVYIIYILDEDSNNIPIQLIESNRTYGRKYVFTEDETITFINGIVRGSEADRATGSPVQEWDKILREIHLTGCLTEAYASKKVEQYLDGQRFEADYISTEEYNPSSNGKIPQIKWVKSLDTTGFREFCFDDAEMEFGQINLFYGANGSGKTSVLEAIEYALTSEVRRVKDFKVKMPNTSTPEVKVYDTEAGIHRFSPALAQKNAKEIERVWYGVPSGRTKTTLNDNFNRFNSFDSEAAYKFIHASDNDAESFATMFGNLMFGETVVGYEKKWQRFKKAFNERYTELRSTLNDARTMKGYYEQSLANKKMSVYADEIDEKLKELSFIERATLPIVEVERYNKLIDSLNVVKKYIDILSQKVDEYTTFKNVEVQISEAKNTNVQLISDRREKNENIANIAKESVVLQQNIINEKNNIGKTNVDLQNINTTINNWDIVQRILSNTDTIDLVYDLIDELGELERDIRNISRIERHTTLVRFLKFDSYERMDSEEREEIEEKLADLKNLKVRLERDYDDAKRTFGQREQKTIELRKIGKTLLVDAQCPLCGQEFESTQELIDIIDSAVVVDSSIDSIISDIQKISTRINEFEKILEREKTIDRAMKELDSICNSVPMVEECGEDYAKLYEYIESKNTKEKRKEEILEQQDALAAQGFSIKNINACREFKRTDIMYLDFEKSGELSFISYLEKKYNDTKFKMAQSELIIKKYEKEIEENNNKEQLLKSEIRELDIRLDNLNFDVVRELEQAINNIKLKFKIKSSEGVSEWISAFRLLYDLTELEINRIQTEATVKFEREMLAEYTATIERETPRVERCAKAVQAFERMPSLNSFVENSIRDNIQDISKFFRWMHHSGEFIELGIDGEGIYAIRGINNEKIRIYQMSTGQRATIAMAVMFALHMAAPDAPQFLLLDEPLATMDDTQVLNVLDILKSMAANNTQIFFTTANGVMINLFKESFRGTEFDYKEFQFIKRLNKPSTIEASSVNSAKTIEELTLDDLTLDFHQFAQIREILRRNQEKLVPQSEWEQLPVPDNAESSKDKGEQEGSLNNFYTLLNDDEKNILDILIINQPKDYSEFKKYAATLPNYKTVVERINEKALEFYGETIIEEGDHPSIYSEYQEELKNQRSGYIKLSQMNFKLPEIEHNYARELEDTLAKVELENKNLKDNQVKEELQHTKEVEQLQEALKVADEKRLLEEEKYRSEEQRRIELQNKLEKSEASLKSEERKRIELQEKLKQLDNAQRKTENLLEKEENERDKARQHIEKENKVKELAGTLVKVALVKADSENKKLKETQAKDELYYKNERKRLQDALKTADEKRILEEEKYKTEEHRRIELQKKLKKSEEDLKYESRKRVELEEKLEQSENLRFEEERQRLAVQNNYLREKQLRDDEQKKEMYRQKNVCQHCGGSFTGLLSKKCRNCGRPKDYK